MTHFLHRKNLTATAHGGACRIFCGLLLLFCIVLPAASILAQSAKITPVIQKVAQANGNSFTINSQTIHLMQAGPDPFDMLVSSAASFDIDSPVEARAEFDPSVTTNGGRVVYRVEVSALDESMTMPDKLPAPNELALRKGGRGQTYQRTGANKLRPQTTVIYRTTVTNTGTFTIPEYNLTAYGRPVKVPAASLTVLPAGATNAVEPPTIIVQLAKEDCYVGQLVKVPLLWPLGPSGGAGALFQPHISGDFIFSEQMPMGMQIGNIERDGKTINAFVQDLLITPLKAGPQEIIAQGHAAVMKRDAKQTNVMDRDDLLVDSEPVTLTVKPLPTEGVPPGFTGAVGNFQPEVPMVSPGEVHAGEPLSLTVLIRGDGNLGRLIPPRIPQMREWESFPPVSDSASASVALQRGFAAFKYTLIPLSDKITHTPVIPFSYFDPGQKAYIPMNIPAAPISVLPGAPGYQAHLPPLESPPPNPEEVTPEKEPVFTGPMSRPGLAAVTMRPLQQRWWFAAMQFVPAVMIGGLWGWDRRRRFLELHPEVIRKRRARRGLRRELQLARRAAASRDAAGFATRATNALREACAPHSAAHPRALVCADVLQELPESQRHGSTAAMIQKFFAASDALRFGGTIKEGPELLSLQPDVERVLAELRTRLS